MIWQQTTRRRKQSPSPADSVFFAILLTLSTRSNQISNVFRSPKCEIKPNQRNRTAKNQIINIFNLFSLVLRFDCFPFASVKLSRGGVFSSNKRIRASEPTTCAHSLPLSRLAVSYITDCVAVIVLSYLRLECHAYVTDTLPHLVAAISAPSDGHFRRTWNAPVSPL